MFASVAEEECKWHSAQVKKMGNSKTSRVPHFSLFSREVVILAYVIRALSLASILLAAQFSFAQSQKTSDAFEHYIASAEARVIQMRSTVDTFLGIDALPSTQRHEMLARLRQGEVVIEKQGSTPSEVPAGLIHDWVGTVFIPKATVAQVLALVQDYDHSTDHYSPDVMHSRLISRQADDFIVFLRLKKHKVITVVLDTEYNVHYGRLDATHQYSFSRSTRISEIAEPGTPTEHPLAQGHDHGFMWRLNSYWAFEQLEDGVLVECEAISLTRDIPTGWDGWWGRS
jgi:hypothetical protein